MTDVLPPGSTIGILGGGQLGRMIAIAAAELGYRTAVLNPVSECPAGHVATHMVAGEFSDPASLERFAALADVVTLEFENVPAETLDILSARLPVRPNKTVLATSQDRWLEKSFFRDNGLPTCEFHKVDSVKDLHRALDALGGAGILKTRRFGYDGKGQVRVGSPDMVHDAFDQIGGVPAILEDIVHFEMEISVIVGRGLDGGVEAYVPVENRHREHILHTTTAPAGIGRRLAKRAVDIAVSACEALNVIGLLAVEMFVTSDSGILVNEIAPRPHNSGHWTIDACLVSQFEQLVRAVTGLPLGQPARHSNAVMTNLIGDEADDWPDLFAETGARVHLYGKTETRPGRKMGHVTRLSRKRG